MIWEVASGVFIGGISLTLVWLGIAALGDVDNPNAPVGLMRFAWTMMAGGAVVGGFAIAKALHVI